MIEVKGNFVRKALVYLFKTLTESDKSGIVGKLS